MAEYRNKVGGVYSLTTFAPIIHGHEEAVREVIESLPVGPQSPLARLDALHLSRLQIFDHLVHQGPRQRHRDTLEHHHLVFTSSFDGELDPYLDAICSRLGAEADSWWSHCVDYPGTSDRDGFKRWIRAHKVDSSLFASAYHGASVKRVRDALETRERLLDFAVAAQGLEPAELQQRFRSTFVEGAA
jgi:hypothetical protein